MKRLCLIATVALILAAGVFPTGSTDAKTGTQASSFQGQGRGRGQCLIVSNATFMCRFGGIFRGKLDGVRRQGRWSLKFAAQVTPGSAGAPLPLVKNESLKEIVFTFVVAPKGDLPGRTIKSPRDAASGLPTGIITDNSDGGFDLSLASPLIGVDANLVAEATIQPGTPLESVFHTITWD